jgi:hypothetical protein
MFVNVSLNGAVFLKKKLIHIWIFFKDLILNDKEEVERSYMQRWKNKICKFLFCLLVFLNIYYNQGYANSYIFL